MSRLLTFIFLVFLFRTSYADSNVKYRISYIPFELQFFVPITTNNFESNSQCHFTASTKHFTSLFSIKERKRVGQDTLGIQTGLRIKIVREGKVEQVVYINSDKELVLGRSRYQLAHGELDTVLELVRVGCKK